MGSSPPPTLATPLSPDRPPDRPPGRPGERWWSLILAPCAVLALGLVLFEVSAFGFSTLAPAAPVLAPDDVLAPGDFRARVHWGTAVLLHLVTCGAALAVAVRVLRSVPRPFLVGRVMPWGVALVGLQMVVALVDGLAPTFQGLFSFTWTRIAEDARYDAAVLGRIRGVVELLNVASAVVPVAVLLAGCLCVRRRPSDAPVEELAGRLADARALLHVGSAMLVTGVVHMAAWTRWPASLVGGGLVGASLEESSAAVVLFWGATYSALAAAWYLPTFLALRAQAVALWERGEHGATDPEGEPLTRDAWLRGQGFADGPLQRLPRLAALAAPLLAGPVGSAVAEFGGSLG